MTRPLPWSYTALDDFKNCPRQYYEKRVIKSVKEDRSEQQVWGERVHKHFEERQANRVPLPSELAEHEAFMQKLEDKPGQHFTELKFGFDRKAKPCHFFATDVWCRGVIDYVKTDLDAERPIATVIDYKTGKPHSKFEQLYLFALYTFAMWPVDMVNVQFYWTKTGTVTKKIIGREEVPDLWKLFIPDLKQYAEAFKTDVWQPRPSGLCHGWCPVTTCEFWKPKRAR
jgi:PD-(D/E)XK nuclease superfamily